MGSMKMRVLGIVVAGFALGLIGTVPAYGDSPWWHLSSASRPTYLQPGQAKDEVQVLRVQANEGAYTLELPGVGIALLQAGETPERVQKELEEQFYGKGNVHVTGGPGPGDNNPYEIYEIEFVRGLADQPVRPVRIVSENVKRLSGGMETQGGVTLDQVSTGRPDGQIVVTAVNLGDASADAGIQPIVLTDNLPRGLKAVAIEGYADEYLSANYPLECSLGSLSCIFKGIGNNGATRVPPYRQIQMRISVDVAGAESGEVNEASVVGGSAPGARSEQAISLSEAPIPFGVSTYEMRAEDVGGSPDTQAGSHPFQLTTTIAFNETYEGKVTNEGRPLGGTVPALTKDLHFDLPPGLIGNPTPFAQCPLGEFLTIGAKSESYANENRCSAQTVIGVARVILDIPAISGTTPFVVPLFNIVPAVGEPARFGFLVHGVPVLLTTALRTGGDYGVTVNVTNISQAAEFLSSEVTFWGVPGEHSHDGSRNWECLEREVILAVGRTPQAKCAAFESRSPPPLLSMPPSCTGPLRSTVEGDSWTEPQNDGLLATTTLTATDGCNDLQFSPSIEVSPDSQAASTPTGLAVRVKVPQEVSLNPEGLAEADVKNTTVALPTGVAVNPAGGDGLEGCSETQIGLKNAASPSCPDASKLGLVKIKTPLLPNPLEGAAYLADQNANPFGSLIAIYVYAEDPISGARVKFAGEVVPNPVTGQLVSTFKNTPELPFETFELHFFGGDRAPLASPASCGAYTTTAAIEPSTGAGEVDSSSTFDITRGPASFDEPAGSPCPGAHRPFAPSLTGGATNIQAGAFSPLTLTFSRKDGEQNMQSVEAHLPPGLSGILSNIELCPEPQANLGECPANSLIGETTVSVGVGGDPFTVGGGKFYLTGPYNGSGGCTVGTPGCAPFGITFEVPAKAGPFDLKRNTANPAGENTCDCVIVRGKIEVDPITAAITVKSDPPGSPYAIPTSIEGIPLEIQHINATTTRGNFQFNPTNCEKMQVTGSIDSSENTPFSVSVPFQVTNCAILGFKPGFKISTSGKTSRANGASLSVKLIYPKAPFGSQANIKSVKVDLPKQLPSRLTTLQKACTAAQFNADPAGCPTASMVGHATAITPLIPVPLTGPAYFVSYGGAKFPELVVVLQGYGVTLDLHGETFINKAGITSSTFHTVPDAPVGSFELNLPQGKYSALAANGNLCKSKLEMPTLFHAQNGMTIKQSTPITVTGCPKHKAAHKATKTRHKKK